MHILAAAPDSEPTDDRAADAPRPPAWRTLVWLPVCALDEIIPDTGVCAYVDGRQIALVRVGAGAQVYAVDNFDPFSKAFVISRGIVGDKDGVPKIASPIFKQSFDLRTGQCLEKPSVSIPTYPVRVKDGQVEVLVADDPAA
jgi:nitrite reductase (NADH) small subunit